MQPRCLENFFIRYCTVIRLFMQGDIVLPPLTARSSRGCPFLVLMAAAEASQFVLCFCLLSLVSPASPLFFSFSNFTESQSTQLISLQGGAKQSDSLIMLNDGTKQHEVGRVLYHDQFRLWDGASGNLISFTTHFSFNVSKINGMAPNGDGLAFFLAPYPAQDIPIQSDGGYLGLFNESTNRVVAVEFDSFQNSFDPFPEANHIGIDVYNVASVAFASLGNFSISNGLVADASVSYDAETMNMSARLSYAAVRGAEWEVSKVMNLRDYLPEDVAVGFSAATGGGVESHAIISWDFKSSEVDLSSTNNGSSHRYRLFFRFLIDLAVGFFVLGFAWFGLWWCRRRQNRQIRSTGVELSHNVDSVLDEPRSFRYEELAIATNNFAEVGKLGEGGFGTVHKAVLSHHNDLPVEVAIKKISSGSRQGEREYLTEIEVFSRLRHPNLVQLIGHCRQDQDFLLVYQYMPNLSLDRHLYDSDRFLDWPTRHKIVIGLASALLYLHEQREGYVLHRDIKPSNVMLDQEFNAKLGDFGLAKLVNHNRDAATTTRHLQGSRGYVAPEYMVTGKPRRESDVYSFGVTALEIVCRRRPIVVNLVHWVWGLYEDGACLEAVDNRLRGEFDVLQMKRLMAVGLWCAHPDYTLRPSIRRALGVLSYDAPLPEPPPRRSPQQGSLFSDLCIPIISLSGLH